jgi:hypothetical protein
MRAGGGRPHGQATASGASILTRIAYLLYMDLQYSTKSVDKVWQKGLQCEDARCRFW